MTVAAILRIHPHGPVAREAIRVTVAALLLLLSSPGLAAPDQWTRLDQQASAQYRQGDTAAAQLSAEQALAIAERDHASGPGAARLATSLNALALIHQAQGHYAEARPLLERALAIAEKALPAGHPNLDALRTNLAAMQEAQDQQAVQAEAQRAQDLNEQALAHHDRSEYIQAAALYQDALPLLEKHFGPDSIEVARVLASLADTHAGRKQYAEAETLYQRTLAIYEGRASEAVARASALNAMAAVYYAQRQYGKAEPLFRRSLETLEAERGPAHVDLLPALDNLTALYLTTRREERAQEFRRRAAAIRKAHDIAAQ